MARFIYEYWSRIPRKISNPFSTHCVVSDAYFAVLLSAYRFPQVPHNAGYIGSAKPVFMGSNPIRCSNQLIARDLLQQLR